MIPGLGRSPGGRRGNPFQYSCLENSLDRGAWQATVHKVAKSHIQLKLLGAHPCDGIAKTVTETTNSYHLGKGSSNVSLCHLKTFFSFSYIVAEYFMHKENNHIPKREQATGLFSFRCGCYSFLLSA